MARKSKAEYIGEKRRIYAGASAAKRRRMLDEVCETLCYTRQYVIKLMTGNIRYRERKGRRASGGARPEASKGGGSSAKAKTRSRLDGAPHLELARAAGFEPATN